MMENKALKALLAVAAITLLQGCGSKVDCNDSDSKKKAIEIIQSHLNTAAWYGEMRAALSGEPELVNVKTLAHNDELKQSACVATYRVTYNKKPRDIDVKYNLAYLQDKKETEVQVAVTDVKLGLMNIAMVEAPVRNGVEEILDPSTGKLQHKREWNNNKLDGTEEIFDRATGNLQHKLPWKNGVLDGVEEVYNPATNKLIAEVHLSNGQRNGTHKQWDASGANLLIDLNWQDGKATGFEKQYDGTGQKLIVDLVWKDGKQTGFVTEGTLNTLYTESNFKDGLKDGAQKTYRMGTFSPYQMYLERIENYKSGKRNGVSQYFNADGIANAENFQDDVQVPMNVSVNPTGVPASKPNNSSAKQNCVDTKVNAYRAEAGADSMVNADMLEEWKSECAR